MEQVEKLVSRLEEYNIAYRAGKPIIEDNKYDELVEKLRELDPFNPFLHAVEPEKFETKKEIRHRSPMLSTEKAYNRETLERFTSRVKKEALTIGIEKIYFIVTPKLDGLAARDDGKTLSSRGNGLVGYEITGVFDKGVIPIGERIPGLGEIVIVKSYFDEYLSDSFEHPRNMVVGIVASDRLNTQALRALKDKAVHFVPYKTLPNWIGTAEELLENYDTIAQEILSNIDYPVDGVVAEVTDEAVKKKMGATAHHYRWQVAIKSKGESSITVVESISWQVGRTGSLTPVLQVNPVSLSGATIKRVTAHHAGMVKKMNLSKGAQIKIIRSGEVIPKLEKVLKPGNKCEFPEKCPSCGMDLQWNKDFLKCLNTKCPSQIEQKIRHWFKTIGNADWFGIKTIKKLVASGFDSLKKIYDMKYLDFVDIGMGPVQSRNLINAIKTSKTKQIEDWRFIAAFGIPNLGTGDARKLLSYIKVENLLNVKVQDIKKIHGFGDITSISIVDGIKRLRPILEHFLSINFNLEKTPLVSKLQQDKNRMAGKKIVFTGKMVSGTREEIKSRARKIGAVVQTSVTSATDYLVCGKKVGGKKLAGAREKGIEVISEKDFFKIAGEEV